MRIRRLVLAALAFAACAPPPQTVDEFRRSVTPGSRFGDVQRTTHRLPLTEAWRRVSTRAETCFNVEVRRPPNPNAQDPGGTSYVRTAFEPPHDGRATIAVQVEEVPQPLGPGRHMPPGGFYQFVVDFESSDRRSTLLTVYGPVAFGFADAFASFGRWAEDPRAPCPPLPY